MSALYSLHTFKWGLRAAQLLPRPLAHALAAAIAHWNYEHPGPGREAIRANLELATGRTGQALDSLCRHNYRNFARMLADYFLVSGARPARIQKLLHEWRGFEHLSAAQALGKGVILITAHLGNWELGGIVLTLRGLPVTVVTLEEPASGLTEWREDYRRRLGIRTIAVGWNKFAFVEMIQALRRNEIVAMLVDRPFANSGEWVEFFGRRTQFSSAPALLHQHTGAAVLPAFVLENDNGGYLSLAEPMIPMEGKSVSEQIQEIASRFEGIIRENPDQWFNYSPIAQPTDEPLPVV